MSNLAEEFLNIPGTTVFDSVQSRKGYHLNMCCISLVVAANRTEFKADQESYLKKFPMTDEQHQAVVARDYNRLLELGGNIYFLGKIAAVDGLSFLNLTCQMAGMSEGEFRDMMLAGGRSVDDELNQPKRNNHG
jgi:protocatechuate 4,5-dioxygenase alpha chain